MLKGIISLVGVSAILSGLALLFCVISMFIRRKFRVQSSVVREVEQIPFRNIRWAFLFNCGFYLIPVVTKHGFPADILPAVSLLLIILADIDILIRFLPFEFQLLLFFFCFFTERGHILWYDKIVGFLVPAALLFGIYQLIMKRQSEGQIGFGFSDVLFGGCIGMIAGWYDGLLSIAAGLVLFGLFSGILLLRGADKKKAVALTPFFVFGLQIVQLFNPGA